MKKKILCILFAEFVCISLLTTGCKRSSQPIDANMVFFERHPFRQSPDVNELFRIALNEYRNKKIDPEPILLFVHLRNLNGSKGREEIYINLDVYDEDSDLMGFTVQEESRDPNGTVHILEEEYPALVHYPNLSIVSSCRIPISIRQNNQKKDEKRWKGYLSMNLDNLKEQVTKHHAKLALPPSSEEAIVNPLEMMEFWDNILKQWQESLPTVWISMPEPNDTSICIQIYDKAGHKSNIVNLIEVIGFKNVKDDNADK